MITADDFGICDAIDDGIIDCIHSLDCIDIFVNYESTESLKLSENGSKQAWDKSSEQRFKDLLKNDTIKARILSGDLKIGLHLSLNSGSPLCLKKNENDLSKFEKRMRRNLCQPVDNAKKIWEYKWQRVPTIAYKLDNIRKIREKKGYDFFKEELNAQYKRFKEIMKSSGLGDYEPFHISSHNGIFGGTPYSYKLLRDFCKERDIEMRCPALIGHSTDRDFKAWTQQKTKMVSDFQFFMLKNLGKFKLIQNGKDITDWLDELEYKFKSDKDRGVVYSTEFFIEHFFLQGSFSNLSTIMLRIKNSKSKREQTYEMVAHPVKWPQLDGAAGALRKQRIPRGVLDGKFEKRHAEREVLAHYDTRQIRKKYEIGIYKEGWKPSLNS